MAKLRQPEYPYVWDRMAVPKGYKDQRCRILKKAKGQGGLELVVIEFRKDSRKFTVQRAGLKRVSVQ